MKRIAVLLIAGAVVVGFVWVSGLFGAESLPVSASGGGASVGITTGKEAGLTSTLDGSFAEGDGVDSSVRDVDAAVAAAVAAGVSAVESMGEVAAAGRISRRSIVRGFTTKRFYDSFIQETNVSLLELDERRTDSVMVEEFALRSSGWAESDGSVSVQVWSVSVVQVADEVRSSWRLVDLLMRFEEGEWRLDGWESSPGPFPAPAQGATFATGLEMSLVDDLSRVDR